jgi:hypothetical protein
VDDSAESVPLGGELRALFYLGSLLILTGAGATVKGRLAELGPMTILTALSAAASACFVYCFRAGRPFDLKRVEQPGIAFDYVLYLGVGLAGVFVSYLEWKWRLLGSWWDLYLFFAGLACAGLAYRFDNRLVLSVALVNWLGWIGLSLRRWDAPALGARAAAIALGACLLGLGEASRRSEVKAHFEESYLRFGVHLVLFSLFYGASRLTAPDLWLLLAACGALAAWSARLRRFEAFAAAVAYAYLGALRALLREVRGGDLGLWTVVLSSACMAALLLWARRRFREDA